MLGLCFYPQCKIETAFFFILSIQFTRSFKKLFQLAACKRGIVMILRKFFNVEVNRSVYLVCQTFFYYFLCNFLLLENVAGGGWFNAWRKHIEKLHHFPKAN